MKNYIGGFEQQGVLVSNWTDMGSETGDSLQGSDVDKALEEAKLDIGYDICYNGVEMYERRAEHCFCISEDIMGRVNFMFKIRDQVGGKK